jgi:N-acetyl-anhydromuramyl-L-alanine amidase AmpD
MKNRLTLRLRCLLALVLCAAAVCAAPASAAPADPRPAPGAAGDTRLQAAFAAAAREFGVPEPVLLAVSYSLTRWESHGGAPSFAGGYGPMHLTHVDSLPAGEAKGAGAAPGSTDTRAVASLHTLDAAAALLGLSPDTLRRDPAQNIRGGAALLAQYARAADGSLPGDAADWYPAVMRYSQASDPRTAAAFADTVYATLQEGAGRTTDDGQTVALPAAAVVPNKPAEVARLGAAAAAVECPADSSVACEFIPAAYALNDPNDLSNYGNYDLASRPAGRLDIRYIVIHDTEGSYASTLQWFQNPAVGSSAHYVVRSQDGHIAQMVPNEHVAWHAGNWYVNGHAVGIEHEGYAIQGATWYTEQLYRASAALVRHLAQKYRIPLDRAHIIGHDDIPGPTSAYQAGMHWDPGPYWDWAHYMELVQGRRPAWDAGPAGRVVTLRIDPATNVQTVKDCEGGGALLTRGVNFVYLRTQPSESAPYIANPYIASDPLCAHNWANKAVSGQSFYRFALSGDWDGIYFGGQEAWFYNPGHRTYTASGPARLVRPRGGAAVPVYGRAYPEAAAYPSGIPAQSVAALGSYTIPPGQLYVAFGPFKSDYYYAPLYTPALEGSVNQDVQGQTLYYQIFYNHRFVFVQAADVSVVGAP